MSVKKTTFYLLFTCMLINSICADSHQIVRFISPGCWQTSRPHLHFVSVPLPAPLPRTITRTTLTAFKKSYIHCLEDDIKKRGGVDEGFFRFLADTPEIRDSFLLALDPVYDNIPRACSILYDLAVTHPHKIKSFAQLAIALALVWDDEDSIQSSRFYGIWGFSNNQFPQTRTYNEIFEYFSGPTAQKVAVFKPQALKWPLLIYLAIYDINAEQTQWVLTHYYKTRKNITKTYFDITYDTQKLRSHRPALGTRKYTLENIKAYNGICGDQSYFATRIAQSFSIPAMKVVGKSRYGGLHSWAGFLTAKKGVPLLTFTGRYRGDMYYTGLIFDPQKRCFVLDRSVQQMFAAVSKKYKQYRDTLVAFRIFNAVPRSETALRFSLMEYAIQRNSLSSYGWDMFATILENRNTNKKDALKKMKIALKALRNHPDAVLTLVQKYLDFLDKNDIKKRQDIYSKAYRIFKKRPDLQIKLLIRQSQELAEAGQALRALTISMNCCIQNAHESALILPLLEIAIPLIQRYGLESKAKGYIEKIDNAFPKKRGGRISQAYREFRDITKGVYDFN